MEKNYYYFMHGIVDYEAVDSNVDIGDRTVRVYSNVQHNICTHSKLTNPSPIILPPLSTPSTTPSSPLSTPYLEQQRFSFSSESTTTLEDESKPPQFIHRVSNIPLVNSALRAYETSKNSISVVKYGAEMVESFAAPIYDKLGKHAMSTGVNEWGCRQLDKLEERYPSYVAPKQEEEDEDGLMLAALARASLEDNEGLRRRRDSRDESMYGLKSRPLSRSTSPHRPYTISKSSRHRQPHLRSKWHQIVMHASSAAGTTAAVVSEESMKCLRYCLTWLQYAAQHIERQISLLQSVLVSLAKAKSTERSVATQESAASALGQIKKEIVNTLRKVVEVVSKYAGSGLPEQAKQAVRGFILALPTRWANLNNGSSDNETSIKLLTFGSESVEMIRSVSLVFSDTIDRAELWLSRLRVVGVAGAQTRDPVKMSVNEQMEM
ncbi:Opi1-domain-containing protein [Backusella circina FSU 941]|nr:Opi1-domain-containing protein [Backusella circina FSU 941]